MANFPWYSAICCGEDARLGLSIDPPDTRQHAGTVEPRAWPGAGAGPTGSLSLHGAQEPRQ